MFAYRYLTLVWAVLRATSRGRQLVVLCLSLQRWPMACVEHISNAYVKEIGDVI